ncbi:MAG: hypothetical protein CMM87_02340, partial [Rickettsiales bacterium]|nr:hypothetical protein [Rickettsiales bacterium]
QSEDNYCHLLHRAKSRECVSCVISKWIIYRFLMTRGAAFASESNAYLDVFVVEESASFPVWLARTGFL